MGNTAAGDKDPVAHSLQSALTLTVLHSMGNPTMQKLGLNNKGSIIEDIGGVDPVKNISQKIGEKLSLTTEGGIPKNFTGKNAAEDFALAVDRKANITATTFLKNIAPESMSSVINPEKAISNRPIEEIGRPFSEVIKPKGGFLSAIKAKLSGKQISYPGNKTGIVNKMGISETQPVLSDIDLMKVKKEALKNIAEKEAIGELTPGQRDLAIKQTFVAIRQLEKGGMSGTVRIKADIADKNSVIQKTSDMKNVKVIGTTIPKSMNDIYGKSKPGEYTFSPENTEKVPNSGDFIVGEGAITGTEVNNPAVSRNNAIFEEAAKQGRADLFLVKRPMSEVQSLAEAQNRAQEIVSGHAPKYDPNYFIEAVGRVTDAKGVNSFLHLGWVSTGYRMEGPKTTDWSSLPKKVQDQLNNDKQYAFNNHKAVKDGFFPAYDSSFNNESIGKSMEAFGIDFIKVDHKLWSPTSGDQADLGFTTSKGFKHIKFEINDNNWKDRLSHEKQYNEESVSSIESSKSEPIVETPQTPSKMTVEGPNTVETSNTPVNQNVLIELAKTESKLPIKKPKEADLGEDMKITNEEISPEMPKTISPLAKAMSSEALKRIPKKVSPEREGDRTLYKDLTGKINEIVQNATNEGREVNKSEKKQISNLDSMASDIMKKYKAVKIASETPLKEESSKARDTYTKAIVLDTKEAIDEYKPGYNNAHGGPNLFRAYERLINSKVPNSKPKNMTQEDFSGMVKDLKSELTGYAKEVSLQEVKSKDEDIKPSKDLKETNFPQKDDSFKTQKEFNNLVSDNFGVKLDENGFMKMDKNGNPVFKDAKYTIDSIPKFIMDEIKANNKMNTVYSSKFTEDLKKMASKGNTEYGQQLSETVDKAFKEMFGDNYRYNWTLNSMLNPAKESGFMSRLFSGINEHGYAESQSKKYIKAKLTGDQEKIGQAAEEVKAIRDIEKENSDILERPTDITEQIGGRIKEVSQEEDMIHDLNRLENLMPGLLKEEAGAGKATAEEGRLDGIRIAEEFRKEYSLKLKAKGKKGAYFNKAALK